MTAFIRGFGAYLPRRTLGNSEIAALVGCQPEWILEVSGIEERRYAEEDETVSSLALNAAQDCLHKCRVNASSLGMVIVASGSMERRFPGPAATVAHGLGLDSTPAIDLPMASAGGLFGIVLAAELTQSHGNILIVGSEKMSPIALRQPREAGVSVLFGDGAGACLIGPDSGAAEILDSSVHSDGAFAEDLHLSFDGPIKMDGRSVILQASRKIPRAIMTVIERQGLRTDDIDAFLLHQANQNLINRVAQTLKVPPERFYSNIRRYGNTSSASMLIAASEWSNELNFRPGRPIIFGAFGAGFHWGALLAKGI